MYIKRHFIFVIKVFLVILKPKDDNFDAKQAMNTETLGNDEILRENTLLLRRNSIQGDKKNIFCEKNKIF